MKLQLDANQQFQLDAIGAAVDLFKGQPAGVSEFSNTALQMEGAKIEFRVI